MSTTLNAVHWGSKMRERQGTYLSNLDLDRGVVLSGDQSVRGGALAGDVEIHNISFVVLHLYYS